MAAKKRGLGERGLGALLAGSKVNLDQELKDHDGELREVPIDLIQRGRYQPRRDMDPAALQELADSIRQQTGTGMILEQLLQLIQRFP